jgi:NAD(P)-dependent dehydrogenase (short-subunit alcohol dehydrogenase family)
MGPLKGRVAVVARATRGAGRGIAHMLGAAGATVYCSGRSTRGHPATPGRPETIEETAELVTAAGGVGLPARTDRSKPEEVKSLFARVKQEAGRLDILVNDIWGGETLMEWRPFWELDPDRGFEMLDRAVRTHILTSRFAVPLMIAQKAGLIVEVTDGEGSRCRGALYYDLAKMGVIRLAYAMAKELTPHGITALAVTPGFRVRKRCSNVSASRSPIGATLRRRVPPSAHPRRRASSGAPSPRWRGGLTSRRRPERR